MARHVKLPLSIIAVLSCLSCCLGARLTEADLGQVVLVDQTELPQILIDKAAFLPDNQHVVLGGWLQWPGAPVVTMAPNDNLALQDGMQAASPRFAIAPDGQSVAFWRKVTVGQQERAQLTVARLDTQMVADLGEPVPISGSMHLAWLVDGPIVYATEDAQRGVGLLYALDLSGDKARKVLELHDGTWKELRPAAAGQALAIWSGVTTEAYAVNCQPGAYVPPTAASPAMPAPDGSGKTLGLDAQGALRLELPKTESVVVDRDVRAAQWRPDGRAILYIKDSDVYLAGPRGGKQRLLMSMSGQDAGVYLRGCTWSADGVGVVVWGAQGTTGRSWRGTLGQERIVGRFSFPKEAPVKAEDRIWVVTKFQKDVFGTIVEPVWSTLKGCFTVTRTLQTPESIVVEAINTGEQAGAVERLALPEAPATSGHISIGLAGGALSTWSRTSTLKFRPGLSGWLEKTKYIGVPETLTVERQVVPGIKQERTPTETGERP